MKKYTKEMEYNELAKRGECFCATSNCGGYGIVVNDGGDAILWRRYCMDQEHTPFIQNMDQAKTVNAVVGMLAAL